MSLDKIFGCRHPSHWGKVCFLSTPDGENCGLVKNLAATGLVSINVAEPLISKLCDSGMENLVNDASTPLHEKHKVLLDGDWIGVCADSLTFVTELRRKRRSKELPHQVLSISTEMSSLNFGFRGIACFHVLDLRDNLKHDISSRLPSCNV